MCVPGFSGQQPINEAIGQSCLGSWGISLGNDQVTQADQGFILMQIQEDRLPIGSRQFSRGVVVLGELPGLTRSSAFRPETIEIIAAPMGPNRERRKSSRHFIILFAKCNT